MKRNNEEENKRLEKEYQYLKEEKEREQSELLKSEDRVESVRNKLKKIKNET